VVDELEEVILALKAAGISMPHYEVLPDGSYYFYYGQKDANPPIHSPESGRQVD
jgi:hypothetical protein